ncbi:MAG: hypothetical protein PHV39_02080, partial [Methanomicrobium sp.]|nr:hypothetical protein [Methanomicrobium sp.]
MAEINVKQYYEGEDGFLIPSEYTISFNSAKKSDLSGLFGKYKALYVDAGESYVDVKVPEDPSLIHVVVNEISEMLKWAKEIDGEFQESEENIFADPYDSKAVYRSSLPSEDNFSASQMDAHFISSEKFVKNEENLKENRKEKNSFVYDFSSESEVNPDLVSVSLNDEMEETSYDDLHAQNDAVSQNSLSDDIKKEILAESAKVITGEKGDGGSAMADSLQTKATKEPSFGDEFEYLELKPDYSEPDDSLISELSEDNNFGTEELSLPGEDSDLSLLDSDDSFVPDLIELDTSVSDEISPFGEDSDLSLLDSDDSFAPDLIEP